MCGIAGIVAPNSKKYEQTLQTMTRALSHRGPDGEGFDFFNYCGLGHRRLSIVDLETGKQPMRNTSGKLSITFNGEIYGYKELKKKECSTYSFQTTSDTEVILALYEKYGASFLSRVPGMFAFALWDERQQTLMGARDRFGEKPFYYAFGKNGEFIFASEIKAILASGLVEPKLCQTSLSHYLKKLYVEPRHTIYENIFTLPPAHCFSYENGNLKVERYWSFPSINQSITMEDAVPEFQRLFRQAVKRQLTADVPVSAFLSGGLDSSTIVAVASEHQHHLKTYSFAFRDSYNELPFAQSISQRYNTEHTELFDDNEPVADLLIKMQNVYDEPFADSSNIPTYMLAKLARQDTKVALSGDGGDELLGGYGTYNLLYHMSKNANQLLWNNQLIWFISKCIARVPFKQKNFLLHRHLGAVCASQYNNALDAHIAQAGIFNQKELSTLGFEEHALNDYVPSWSTCRSLDDAMRVDLDTYMPGDILVKTDRAAMAAGLELRTPFLDVDFATFCMSLPYSLKVKKDQNKCILREAFGYTWSPKVQRRAKHGFGAPVSRWLNDERMMALKHEYLSNQSRRIFQIMPFNTVAQIAKQNNYKTWTLLVLSLWLENHPCSF